MLTTLLAAALVQGPPAPAPHAGPRPDANPLARVAFVGDLDGPRAAAFTEFLAARFPEVRAHERDGLDPAALAGSDVVLLDWDQGAGVMRWFDDRSLELQHPLGPREAWRIPTVLLGSAGLNTAAAWDVRGGSG